MQPIKNVIKFLLVRPYYYVKSTWFVWNLINTESRNLYKRAPLPLDAFGEKVAEGLERDGIYVTHIDEAFPGSDWFQKLTAYAAQLEADAQVSKKKSFFNDLWDMNRFLLDLKNAFLQFVLTDRILAIASAYMGMYVRLHSLRLMKTVTVKEGADPEHSQLWHRDNGNNKYLKVFLYLNDVSEATGPFRYVKGSQPGGKWYHIFPQCTPYSPRDPRIEDDALAALVPKEDVLSCTGRAGTMIFVDTVGIHKGGYSTEGERFTMLGTFFTKASLTGVEKRHKFLFPENFREEVKKLSPQAQFAIEKM